jgi:hypothetical protein
MLSLFTNFTPFQSEISCAVITVTVGNIYKFFYCRVLAATLTEEELVQHQVTLAQCVTL